MLSMGSSFLVHLHAAEFPVGRFLPFRQCLSDLPSTLGAILVRVGAIHMYWDCGMTGRLSNGRLITNTYGTLGTLTLCPFP